MESRIKTIKKVKIAQNTPEKLPEIAPRFRYKIVKKSSDTIMEMAYFEQLPNHK